MRLDDVQFKKLTTHLESKCGSPSCPACGKNTWTVTRDVFELTEFHGAGTVVLGGGAVLPVSLLTCHSCFYVLLFSTLGAGIDLKDGDNSPQGAQQ